ncbi:MAG: hypothetical protein EOM05_01525 [Clostridia bacterium]|nr:hypothetical protein [Clostridia bacterium]
MSKKTVAIIISAVIVCVGVIGGTLAWLTDSKEITNTFTVGDINIALDESSFDANNAKLVPGTTIEKNPTVTVKANSEDCFVYVMIDNNLKANDKTIGTLNVAADWEVVATQGNKTIYKYTSTVESATTDNSLPAVFTQVAISGDNIVKADLEALEEMVTVVNTTIEVKAYAHQAISQKPADALAAFEAILGGDWA